MGDFSQDGMDGVTAGNLRLGQVVSSRAGRDSGKHYIVTAIVDERFVRVSDGDRRSIKKPKRKNLRHLRVHAEVFLDLALRLEAGEDVPDSAIRRYLVSLKEGEESTKGKER